MTEKLKILFLVTSPIATGYRLGIDRELRAINKIVRAPLHSVEMEIVSEFVVRASDLQEALLKHLPDILHVSGAGNRTQGVTVEDESGKARVIHKEALAELFQLFRNNIRAVVLSGCYDRDQAVGISESIDYTIGIKSKDEASLTFVATFYSNIRFGRSLKNAFDLAQTEILLRGIRIVDIPDLLIRKDIDEDMVAAFSLGEVIEGRTIIQVSDLVGRELIEYFSKHPDEMKTMNRRLFEEFVAELFYGFGYDVELTKQTRDGGKDIIAIKKQQVEVRYLIECKRPDPGHYVSVRPVRELYGVKTSERATKAIMATTAYFSPDAVAFYEKHRWELELKDYEGIQRWIKEYFQLRDKVVK